MDLKESTNRQVEIAFVMKIIVEIVVLDPKIFLDVNLVHLNVF